MCVVRNKEEKHVPCGELPCILESNPALVFADFLNEKKKLVRGSNPHLWEDDGEDKDDSDWVTDNDSVMSIDGESDE